MLESASQFLDEWSWTPTRNSFRIVLDLHNTNFRFLFTKHTRLQPPQVYNIVNFLLNIMFWTGDWTPSVFSLE